MTTPPVVSIPAAHHGGPRPMPPRIIVIHDAEVPELSLEARVVADFFHNQAADDPNPTSVQACVDDLEVVTCLPDDLTAYAAGPTANRLGLHVEQAGYARQTRAGWLDAYSLAQIAGPLAWRVATWCIMYRIPPLRAEAPQLRAGAGGICGHADTSAAWGETTHTDPGPGYPWDVLLSAVIDLLHPPLVDLEDPDMPKALVLHHRAGHVAAWYTVEVVDGVVVLRWVQSTQARANLVLLGIPQNPPAYTAAALALIPVLGPLPPAG